MAQTKKKRRRKHSGTQAGTVERRASSGSGGARGKADSKETARERREARLNTPPSWRGAVIRAAIAAVIFAIVVILLFKRPPVQGLGLAGVMFVIYIPMSYFTDRFVYNRRQRQKRGGGGPGKGRFGR